MYVDMIRLPTPPLEGGAWLNGGPVRTEGPSAGPLLLDFWDYASLPSLSGIPYLLQWHARYVKLGLGFVGIQIPSYPFGSESRHVEAALRRLGLPYPVLIDAEGAIRKAFAIRSVPSRYVMDKDGFLRFCQIGDEDYENTELFLQQALREKDRSLPLPELLPPIRPEDRVGGFRLPCTPEIRLAEEIGNPAGTGPGEEAEFELPSSIEEGSACLGGRWRRAADGPVLTGAGSVRVRYRAAEVYLLAAHPDGANVAVRLDGASVASPTRGEDLQEGAGGETILGVGEPRLYQVIREEEVGTHVLDLETETPDLILYSFQFASKMPRPPS